MTILEKIKQNAKEHPERIAYVSETQRGKSVLTWEELNDFSDIFASYLCSELKTKTPVVVYGHKDPYMIVCFLACVKSGRAYCPIDVNVPLTRIQAIIDEVEPEMILATEPLDIESKVIKNLDEIKRITNSCSDTVNEENYVNSEDLFYIIFTSGSTGVPKGVQITRDCLDNFIRWAKTLGSGFDDGKHRVFLNQAPFSFDLSVMDLYLCLYTAGTLWTLDRSIQTDMKQLLRSLEQSNANVWVSTPSFTEVCLSDPGFSEELMPELNDFLFCGEVLTNITVDRLNKRFPNSCIVNTYGPTESTCAVTEVRITPELNKECFPLPVGKPKEGTWIRITDKNGNTVPDGEHGEIVIVGDSVSPGYCNNSEKNNLSFGVTKQNSAEYRYYKTGDEGYIINGMLYYCGRIDNQVKLHGYRIELEDIESNLLKISGIVQAVCIPRVRNGKTTSLVAGIVSTDHIEDEKTKAAEIKNELKKSLPEYMIPKTVKFLSNIPRTNNGKIDRKLLGGIL